MYPELRTERLLLRPLGLSDLENVHRYASDAENTRYMYSLPDNTIGETEEFLFNAEKEWKKDMPGYFEFAIELGGMLIGHISLYLDDKRESGEMGWILDKKHWRCGYAAEAAAALKEFAIRELRLKRLIAQCDYRNTASSHVMEKIGLKLESDDGVRVYLKKDETARELLYSLNV